MTNRINKSTDTADDDLRFDRLADGELPAAEYRTFLASLDDEPGGWRRCALAFLESQALAADLPQAAASPGSEKLAPRSKAKTWGQVLSLLAVAASFLVAFALGIAAPRFFSLARQELLPGGNLNMQAVNESASGDDDFRPTAPRRIGNLRLVMDGPGGQSTDAGQVPVYEVSQDLNQFLSQENPALGPELIELLRQRGYDVRHEQQYFPAAMDDGRQIVVPVDGYQITPVSRRY
jgi:hypothetical protein